MGCRGRSYKNLNKIFKRESYFSFRIDADNFCNYLVSEMYHILYDGTIEDEKNYAAMGGQSDDLRRFLKDHYREAMTLAEALQLAVRALNATQNKTLTERDLEVAVLDRLKARRKFRRIPAEALAQLLVAPR